MQDQARLSIISVRHSYCSGTHSSRHYLCFNGRCLIECNLVTFRAEEMRVLFERPGILVFVPNASLALASRLLCYVRPNPAEEYTLHVHFAWVPDEDRFSFGADAAQNGPPLALGWH